jgi:hypothetical protein
MLVSLHHSQVGHSNIKMTERYANLAWRHIARTGSTAREPGNYWNNHRFANDPDRLKASSRVIRATETVHFWLLANS